MSYIPTPIDTSTVSLPPELTALGEKLAENAPDLPELEKEKDRSSVRDYQKHLTKAGYDITFLREDGT